MSPSLPIEENLFKKTIAKHRRMPRVFPKLDAVHPTLRKSSEEFAK